MRPSTERFKSVCGRSGEVYSYEREDGRSPQMRKMSLVEIIEMIPLGAATA